MVLIQRHTGEREAKLYIYIYIYPKLLKEVDMKKKESVKSKKDIELLITLN